MRILPGSQPGNDTLDHLMTTGLQSVQWIRVQQSVMWSRQVWALVLV
jgi:hypothetical protein